jgi:hypothetical protein
MQNTIQKYRGVLGMLASVFMTIMMVGSSVSLIQIAHAQTGASQTPAPQGTGQTPGMQGTGQTPNNSGGSVTILNPLQSKSLEEFLGKIIDVIFIFALPIVVFFIMYAGFLFVTAKGQSEQISTAKTALTWAVVGGVVVFGAKIIITVIQGTVSAF